MDKDEQLRPLNSNTPPPALRYTVNQYVEHPDLVKQTNEWMQSNFVHQLTKLEDQLRETENSLQETKRDLTEKDKQLHLKKQELDHLKEGSLRTSIIQQALAVLTVLLFGIGINFATSTPPNGAGWPMVCFAVITQSISFYMTYSEARKNS